MYDFLSGTIVERKPSHIVLDVQGVGYFISISLQTYSATPEVGEQCSLCVHLVVREDDLHLYGFADATEREIFRLLISVSGIGPRLGQTILSGIAKESLLQAIAASNVDVLTKISGIGKKTAQRMVIELKEKIEHLGDYTLAVAQSSETGIMDTVMEDAVGALMSLGYKRANAAKAIQSVSTEGEKVPLEELVRKALTTIK